jgi:hypothetical protein
MTFVRNLVSIPDPPAAAGATAAAGSMQMQFCINQILFELYFGPNFASTTSY